MSYVTTKRRARGRAMGLGAVSRAGAVGLPQLRAGGIDAPASATFQPPPISVPPPMPGGGRTPTPTRLPSPGTFKGASRSSSTVLPTSGGGAGTRGQNGGGFGTKPGDTNVTGPQGGGLVDPVTGVPIVPDTSSTPAPDAGVIVPTSQVGTSTGSGSPTPGTASSGGGGGGELDLTPDDPDLDLSTSSASAFVQKNKWFLLAALVAGGWLYSRRNKRAR